MIRVYSSQDRTMVGHFKNLLENEGISCIIKNELLSIGVGELPPINCWPELWITDDSQFKLAEKIVESALSSDVPTGSLWKCPECGEEIELQFSECWNCGKSRDEIKNP